MIAVSLHQAKVTHTSRRVTELAIELETQHYTLNRSLTERDVQTFVVPKLPATATLTTNPQRMRRCQTLYFECLTRTIIDHSN